MIPLLPKEITFFASKTQITTKQGLAKENKFNTVLGCDFVGEYTNTQIHK
jgi:hypothetical protein